MSSIFDKVEELYIARKIGSLKDMDDGWEYNNLKRLILGVGSPYYLDPGGRINWKTLQYLKSELPSPPYLYDVFTTAQYTTMEVEVPMESLNLYKTAYVWGNFWNIQGFNGIDNIFEDSETLLKVYRCNGLLYKANIKVTDLHTLPNGYYIVVSPSKTWKIKI